MNDLNLIFNEIMIFLNTSFYVFGFRLSILSFLIGCSVITIVCFAVRKMLY